MIISKSENIITLPSLQLKGEKSLEETILKRRSQREFTNQPLTLREISQILWAAQGVTGEKEEVKLRTAPSAGALYPLELYLVAGESGVENLNTGVYHYLPENHTLELSLSQDIQDALTAASLNQSAVSDAPVVLVITAEYERTTKKYGERGIRYVWIEVGHAAQNVALQVVALGLGTVTIGAFDDTSVSQILNLPEAHKPLYILPIGRIRQ